MVRVPLAPPVVPSDCCRTCLSVLILFVFLFFSHPICSADGPDSQTLAVADMPPAQPSTPPPAPAKEERYPRPVEVTAQEPIPAPRQEERRTDLAPLAEPMLPLVSPA